MIKNNKAVITRLKQRFIDNYEGFFKEYSTPIRSLIYTAILDAFSTYCFMYVLGVENEIHPIVRYLSVHLGVLVGPFVGGALIQQPQRAE